MNNFRKRASRAGIVTEAASLRWLADAVPAGGAAVVELVALGDDWLETRRLQVATPSRSQAAAFGRGLAWTHAAGAPWWGAPPPGLDVADARLAELPAPVVAQRTYDSWGRFYASDRLQPYLAIAVDNHTLGRAEARRLQAAIDVVATGAHDSPQPVAVGDGRVARLHGDLWGGNVLWARIGDDVVGTLIDPSAHGGHAETDLAELALFGSPHLADTIAGYQEVSPLADGWRERVPLHNFHMLLVHVAIFGGGYIAQALAVADRLN